MAKKAETKKTKKETVTYKGIKHEVLERTENRILLTDGTIHFWVKADSVKGE